MVALSTRSVRRVFQSSLSAWRRSVASFGSGCWAPACCVVVCSGTCRLGKGRLGISCMVALLAKSVDRSGRSALSKKPGQDTAREMTNRLLYPFVSTNGVVYTNLEVKHKTNVGVSLLAIAVYQSTSSLNDTPLSRAGSLPQGVYSVLEVICRPWQSPRPTDQDALHLSRQRSPAPS
ncbi:hypothetical protein D9M73_214770 [compost metagenome]